MKMPKDLLERVLSTPTSAFPETPMLTATDRTIGEETVKLHRHTQAVRTPGGMSILGVEHSMSPLLLSPAPSPVSSTTGAGVLVRMTDGKLAIRTIRKTLRISAQEGGDADHKQKQPELAEGDEVIYKTDGSRAFEIKRRFP